MKSRLLLLCFFLVSVLAPDPGTAQTTLKVGGLIPFSGRWGDAGRECAKGMLDAGKWLNQRGGIYGRKLEISLIDDRSQPAEIMAAYRKLNEADHVLLLYVHSVETGLSLAPHLRFHRIPTLFSTLPHSLADPSQYPYFFSITPTPLDLARVAMQFISTKAAADKVRKPKVVFIGSPEYGDQHFLDEARAYGRSLGLEIGKDFRIPDLSSGKSPPAALSAMGPNAPDFAYLNLTSKEALPVLLESRKLGLKTRWVCNTKTFDENLAPLDGVMGVQPISPFGEEVPGMTEIKEAHRRWHASDSHTLFYVEGWATVRVMAEVLGRALPETKLSRDRLRHCLEELKDFIVGGLVPPLTISAKDHRPSVESRVLITRDGKLLRQTGFISVER